ncbi:hypothetical protein TELCIR_09388 [Teladorsagia circumcincta]|uniref:Aminotransferase class I/classII large domain-containing protein n=1 Tax=Teladorsagia circumcincta TaxID=45464 RepID=A0A2G9UEZ7_TELCI|nr:hypothetical protein TELCIR_09388 [Teladorsagia circumcincta]
MTGHTSKSFTLECNEWKSMIFAENLPPVLKLFIPLFASNVTRCADSQTPYEATDEIISNAVGENDSYFLILRHVSPPEGPRCVVDEILTHGAEIPTVVVVVAQWSTRRTLTEESVYCLPGSAFSSPGWIRLVITHSEEVTEEAMRRIRAFCERRHTEGFPESEEISSDEGCEILSSTTKIPPDNSFHNIEIHFGINVNPNTMKWTNFFERSCRLPSPPFFAVENWYLCIMAFW